MNANKTLIAVSTIAAAVTAMAVAFPVSADEQRGSRRERPGMVTRHAPPAPAVRCAGFPPRAQPQRVVVERPVFRQPPPVAYRRPVLMHRPVVVERPVVVRRTVVVERPAPVYYHEPRPAYAYVPAPV